MFGKYDAKKNYLFENKHFSFYDNKVAMQEFDLYSCYNDSSVTK